jgi:hypothetical protein
MSTKIACCYLKIVKQDDGLEEKHGCTADATWGALAVDDSPEMETYACDDHLGHVLSTGQHTVWPAEQPE